MWKYFLVIVAISTSAFADTSFEQNYQDLQKKIEALKERGGKVTEDTRKEIDALMVQMNHEHSRLKRELEAKNQVINQKLEESKHASQDWTKRLSGAAQEFTGGIQKAWKKLSKGGDE